MKNWIVAAVATLTVAASPASGQTDEQIDAVVTLAQAYMLSEYCGRASIDGAVMADRLDRFGLVPADIDDGGAFHMVARMAIARASTELEGSHPSAACTVARRLFGPSGSIIPGLVVDD